MHAGKAAERHIIVNAHMAGQRGMIGEHRVVADPAVMGDMRRGHDPVMVADHGLAAAARGAAIDGDIFAHGIVRADL